MTTISTTRGTIIWPIFRGSDASLVINKSDGWAGYDEIVMDFKNARDLNANRIFRLTIGSGLTISGNSLLISVGNVLTAKLKPVSIWADIKLRVGQEILPPIPFQIQITETVTKL